MKQQIKCNLQTPILKGNYLIEIEQETNSNTIVSVLASPIFGKDLENLSEVPDSLQSLLLSLCSPQYFPVWRNQKNLNLERFYTTVSNIYNLYPLDPILPFLKEPWFSYSQITSKEMIVYLLLKTTVKKPKFLILKGYSVSELGNRGLHAT